MTSEPAELLAHLAVHGWARVDLGEGALARLVQPWLLVDGLLGLAPQLIELQPIRPVDGARSFAASTGVAPLHTDSQPWRARPAELQLTACLRPADAGGESVLVDGFALASRLAVDAPALYDALLHRPRCMPFVFGAVFGPTLARRGDGYVFTHTPRPVAADPVASALGEALGRAPVHRIRIEERQALLVDNHRMLHGRDGFTDPRRELVRALVWLGRPLAARPAWAEVADQVHARLVARLGGHSPEVQRAFGIEASTLGPMDAAVTAMLSGAPPGALARRFGVEESALYRHRAAVAAIQPAPDPNEACLEVLGGLHLGAGDR